MSETNISLHLEHALDAPTRAEVTELLRASFPDIYPNRAWFKQLPHFRLLARRDGRLVGYLAVDHRVIRVGDEALRVFGVIDLCVAPDQRGRGLGARLLERFRRTAEGAGVSHLLLFADDPRLYEQAGLRAIDAATTWLAVDDHRTLGVRTERLGSCLMVSTLGGAAWPVGDIDLLGYLF